MRQTQQPRLHALQVHAITHARVSAREHQHYANHVTQPAIAFYQARPAFAMSDTTMIRPTSYVLHVVASVRRAQQRLLHAHNAIHSSIGL